MAAEGCAGLEKLGWGMSCADVGGGHGGIVAGTGVQEEIHRREITFLQREAWASGNIDTCGKEEGD